MSTLCIDIDYSIKPRYVVYRGVVVTGPNRPMKIFSTGDPVQDYQNFINWVANRNTVGDTIIRNPSIKNFLTDVNWYKMSDDEIIVDTDTEQTMPFYGIPHKD